MGANGFSVLPAPFVRAGLRTEAALSGGANGDFVQEGGTTLLAGTLLGARHAGMGCAAANGQFAGHDAVKATATGVAAVTGWDEVLKPVVRLVPIQMVNTQAGALLAAADGPLSDLSAPVALMRAGAKECLSHQAMDQDFAPSARFDRGIAVWQQVRDGGASLAVDVSKVPKVRNLVAIVQDGKPNLICHDSSIQVVGKKYNRE